LFNLTSALSFLCLLPETFFFITARYQAKQLKDYENAVIQKRLEELEEDEVQAMLEDIEREQREEKEAF
jgi:hypothetical protein